MKNTNPKILVIVGTTRQNRVGRKVADWYLKEAVKTAPELNFELYDLADLNLPVFNEPMSPMLHQYSPLQQKLAEKIGSADGFIFVTGEYNHSIPSSLKNFLDYLYAEWNYKAAGYVGYGVVGGVRSIEHLIQVMTELKVASLRDHITIHTIWSALDEKGSPKPEFMLGNIAKQLEELQWWTNTLKKGRENLTA